MAMMVSRFYVERLGGSASATAAATSLFRSRSRDRDRARCTRCSSLWAPDDTIPLVSEAIACDAYQPTSRCWDDRDRDRCRMLLHTRSRHSSWSAGALCIGRSARFRSASRSGNLRNHHGLCAMETTPVELNSTITCPHCGHSATETMPTDACVGFYPCKGCGKTLRPKQGDCCVFCSHGSVPCPPIQEERAGGEPASCRDGDSHG